MRDRDDLIDYYQKELDYLFAMGEEFQSKHQGISAHLQIDRTRADDPHIGRLLEGFAFLTARIRAKLDDEFPEITDAFLEMLYPNLLRPFPSASIVQFARRPHAEVPAGGEIIPAGIPLRSRHADYRDCRFRTVYPVTLWPLEIVDVELLTDRIPSTDRRGGDAALLRLTIRSDTPDRLASLDLDRLRFHLGGEDRVAYALYDLIGSAATRVEVKTIAAGLDPPSRVVLELRTIEVVGFEADQGMVPYPRRVPRGYRFLQEYASFPHKFLFFDLKGLRAVPWGEISSAFEILIYFDRTPKDEVAVGPRHVRLGCTPIVNLFGAAAQPIRLTGQRSRYPVIPNVAGESEIFRIERVASARGEAGAEIDYRAFYDYRPNERDRTPPFWHAHRRPAAPKGSRFAGEMAQAARRSATATQDAEASEIDLTFVGEDLDPYFMMGEESVNVSLSCTNGDAPFGMPIDQRGGDFEPEGAVACGPVRCLLPPTKSIRPATRRGTRWRLIANLSLNYLSIVDNPAGNPGDDGPGSARDALVDLLQAYTSPADSATRDRIAGIVSVNGRRVLGPAPGGLGAVGGVEVQVRFDESRFFGHSSLLLENILDRFFGLYISINSFSRLVVVDDRGGVIRRRPGRAGEKPLL